MALKLILACLLCTVLVTCVLARPSRCQENRPSRSLVERLMRRSAAIASSIRNLRSVRERRWASSPVWKNLHNIQERAMDISNLPPLPVPDDEQAARDFDEEQAAVQKELHSGAWGKHGSWGGGVEEGGFWHHEPFVFPELSKTQEVKGGETENADLAGSWAPVEYDSEGSLDQNWGPYSEPCSDDIVGNPCTRNGDCHGCRAFHCSSNRCKAGEEPNPHFAGFF